MITDTKSFALYGTSACSAPNCCKNWCVQSMQPVWRTKSEVSWHRECEGADTSYLVVSLYLRRYLGCTPELTVWLGWSEHHGKICMCPESSVLRYAGIFARPSVFVLTDTVLLHSGHLYDDSCIASGPYAKYKSMNIMDMLCYGLRGLAVNILFHLLCLLHI